MTARSRLSIVIGVIGLGLMTAGCETSDIIDKMHDFNPFGTGKSPLPGERRAVFPEGVPGVQQGVPPELMRGAQGQAALEPKPADPPAQAAPKRAEKPKPKPKPRVAQPRPPRPAPPPAAAEQQPAPARPRQASQPAPAAQPAAAAPAAAPWTPPPQPAPMTVWPDPPKPGQFSR